MESNQSPENPQGMPEEAPAPPQSTPSRESFLKRILNNLKRKESGQSAPIETKQEGGLREAFVARADRWHAKTERSLNEEQQRFLSKVGSDKPEIRIIGKIGLVLSRGGLTNLGLGEMATRMLRDGLQPEQPQPPTAPK